MSLKEYKAAWYQANKARIAANAKLWYEKNREAVIARSKAAYAANPDKRKAEEKARYAALPPEAKAVRIARAAQRDRDYPQQAKARTSLRRKAHQRAAPPWLTKGHKRVIKSLYERAQQLTEETGVLHSVDHIVPLQGRTVCGLHTPWNLRVLPHAVNIQKSNRTWPGKP